MTVIAGVVVVASAVVAVVVSQGDTPTSAGPAPSVSAPARPPTAAGVFRTTDRDEVRRFSQWAGMPVDYVVDFSARQTWAQISSPDYMLTEWKDTGYRPVYGVAMLPTGTSDAATIRSGAAGRYDKYFTRLATKLVAADQANAILRVGWEFNIAGSRWGTDDEKAWITFYRRIVTAMRAVPGQKFAFDWNVNNGDGNRVDAVDYYPGDAYVDYIGVDAYDTSGKPGTYPYPTDCSDLCRSQRQTDAWDEQIYGGSRGLRFWSRFASEHGKPMSLPEWGVWERKDGQGGGDDPEYIRRMHAFITDPVNNVAYQAYFEYDGDGRNARHRLMSTFPQSGAAFRELFGAR